MSQMVMSLPLNQPATLPSMVRHSSLGIPPIPHANIVQVHYRLPWRLLNYMYLIPLEILLTEALASTLPLD